MERLLAIALVPTYCWLSIGTLYTAAVMWPAWTITKAVTK